jgi:hypothetical protein
LTQTNYHRDYIRITGVENINYIYFCSDSWGSCVSSKLGYSGTTAEY